METETGLQIDIQHHDERNGCEPEEMFLVMNGEVYELTKADAARIAGQLQAFAREMK